MTRPNILLVVLDATRADACSCYNPALAERPTTPHLDRLAAEGTLFEQAISSAPWTLPAVASIFTGLFPSQSNVYAARNLPSFVPSLPQLLREEGYATFGLSNNSWLSTDFGLTRGFDHFHKLWQWLQTEDDITSVNLTQRGAKTGLARAALGRALRGNVVKNVLNLAAYRFRKSDDEGASRTLAPTRRWIDGQRQPWFAMVHFLEAHIQLKPPRQWATRFVTDWTIAERLLAADQRPIFWRHIAGTAQLNEDELRTWRELYWAEVAYQDHHFGQLLEWLRETGRLDDTLVVVLADHGENLGEHGLLSHQYCLFDTLLHVPLVVRGPGVPRGQRMTEPVQTQDMFHLMLDAANIAAPHAEGRNPLGGTGSAPRVPFTVSEYATPSLPPANIINQFGLEPEQFSRFMRGLTTLRTASHKLIMGTDGSTQLYDLQRDPGETQDIASAEPARLRELQSQLEAWWAARGSYLIDRPDDTADQTAVSADVQARLQALGYLE